ncbi:MAG TPA: ATP-binding protein [Lacipirellulaceae bacterium]|jgi:signal transduction histidine kinase|nr:ATP-binding protein [Lacipirellulaceae bacterium]
MTAPKQLDRTPVDDSSATVQRLMDQYTEIARLAGGLAHEIKNPLSTIRLNMELLAEDLGEAQTPVQRRAAKRIDIVRRECQRLQSLLDDFLNFAKVRRLHLEPSDLNHQIDDVLDFFAPEAAEAGVEIVRYLDPDLPRVLIDREAFRQALLNLIINAKQAMPDGGQLIVRTASQGDTVATYLIDTGCGMDEHTASRMFETFFSTKPGGSGLGLPTTQKIIAGLGGRISVQSEVGRGTQFTIELPVPARIAGLGE